MNNLPDDVTQKMIDSQYGDSKPREDYEFREDDSHSFSYEILDQFLNELKERGDVTSSEYADLTKHLVNMGDSYEQALLINIQINSKLKTFKRAA